MIPVPSGGSGQPNIARRTIWLGLAYLVVTGGLLTALLLELRNETVAASRKELSAFAQLTAGHTSETILGIEESLKLVEVTLSVASDTSSASEDSIRTMLRDVAGSTRGLQEISVLDARGRVVYSGRDAADIGLDRSDQPYFQRFQAKPGLKFDVGTPLRRGTAAAPGDWFIPAAHVWRKARGEFGGVIVGVLSPQFFDRAWTFDTEIAGLSIGLTGADGGLIMRRPFVPEMFGRPIAGGQLEAQLLLTQVAGTLEVRNSIDGQTRLVAYRKLAAYPALIAFVAQPMDVVLGGWRRIAGTAVAGWLLGSLALAGLGAWLVRVMRARGALESRYHTLFDSIPYPVIVSNRKTRRILALNEAAVRQYGWSRDEIVAGAMTTDIAYLPQDRALLAAKREGATRTPTETVQGLRHRRKDGTTLDVELIVSRIEYDGKPAGLTVAVDVSDRLREERARRIAEEQLRRTQRMDVLGQLTGGIAHDFNNVLTVIMDNAEGLAETSAADPEAMKRLGRITDSAQRAEELTRQMLAFSRKQPLRPRPTNINDLMASTGKMLRRTLGAQIEIDSVLADDLWTVDIDRAQLETALVNLCLNARDAMPAGGRLLIETKNVVLDAAATPDVAPGAYVLLTVSDNGRGIPPRDLDKVFEPFFTTKDEGKGSGLGLSMVYGFVKQSNGHIAADSTVDSGTTFKLYLPRHLGAPDEAAVRVRPVVKGGSERILVVEDNPQVRASVVGQLQSLGYDVSQAEDGAAGLASFEAASPSYALLLTDVVMPGGMNGKALADRVALRWPAARIVFMSGYTDNALTQDGNIDATVRLLNKPFRKSDLALIVRQALDGAAIPGAS